MNVEFKYLLEFLLNHVRVCVLQLNELADRNAECVEMLHESQEEIRELRNKNTPSAGMRRHLSYGLYPMVRETHARVLCSSNEEGAGVEEHVTCYQRHKMHQKCR